MITDVAIEEFLNPHLKSIRTWFDEALIFVNDMASRMSEEACRCYKRSQATVLNNMVLEKAKPYFKDKGIDVDDKYDSLVLNFDCAMISRFKKLSKYNLVSNHADNNRNQAMIQGTLFSEYPPSVFVEIGHIMDKLGIDYEKIVVVKRVEKVAIALFEIMPLEKAESMTVVAKAQEIEEPKDKEQEEKQIRKRKDNKS